MRARRLREPRPMRSGQVQLAWRAALHDSRTIPDRTDQCTHIRPDDPTLQEQAGQNQRVQGAEFGINGYLTEHWEIAAGYTLLDPKITSSTITGEVGRLLPNTARGTANLWVTYESDDAWRIGAA